MTLIAARVPSLQSDQIVKRGKTARGTQRYLCQKHPLCQGRFLLDYCNRGCLPESQTYDYRHESQCQWSARYGSIVAYLSQHHSA